MDQSGTVGILIAETSEWCPVISPNFPKMSQHLMLQKCHISYIWCHIAYIFIYLIELVIIRTWIRSITGVCIPAGFSETGTGETWETLGTLPVSLFLLLSRPGRPWGPSRSRYSCCCCCSLEFFQGNRSPNSMLFWSLKFWKNLEISLSEDCEWGPCIQITIHIMDYSNIGFK